LWGGYAATGGCEPENGGYFLRILECDVLQGAFTGRNFKCALAENGVSICEFNMIAEDRAHVIERD
jgi:hypothetical protein